LTSRGWVVASVCRSDEGFAVCLYWVVASAYRLLVQLCGVLGARLPRFEFEGVGARVRTVCVVTLLVSSVSN
ncbi:hypothetical protein Taro_007765, partial [Colocasia esculenta]|nr:hypothetical protein [Colocasia esculenta]